MCKPSRRSRFHKPLFAVLAALLLSALLALLVRHSQYVMFSLDEHQFVAAGAMIARHGLLPFVDYSFYHLPNLPLIYAAVFLFTDQLFASARAVSAVAAWLGMTAIFLATTRSFRGVNAPLRAMLGAGAVMIVLVNPFFLLASGRTWNQDLPIGMGMLAMQAMWKAAASVRRPGKWAIVSGLCLGMAIGTRITVAPLMLGMLLLVPMTPRPRDVRLTIMGGLLGGAAITLGPSIHAWLANPDSFWYGNLMFPLANLQYQRHEPLPPALQRALGSILETRQKPGLLLQWFSQPSMKVLLGGMALLVAPAALMAWTRRGVGTFAVRSVTLLLPLWWLGALSPLPMWPHYFYAAVPPTVLAIVVCAGYLQRRLPVRSGWLAMPAVAVVVIATAAIGAEKFGEVIANACWPSFASAPARLASASAKIGEATDARRILTLSPMLVIEAGRDIHPGTVGGAIPFRMTSAVPESMRERAALVGVHNIEILLAQEPPEAILTGVTILPAWEQPMVNFAREHRYRAVDLGDRRILWLAPTPPSASSATAAVVQ